MGAIADYFGAPMRILLVEDDPDIQAEFARTVDQSPEDLALVAAISNELDVVRTLESIAVDCVFLDDSLTRKPWPQVVQDILKAQPGLRVVIFTEYPSERLLDECLRAGARRPIRKHLPLPELTKAIESMLDDERRLKMQVQAYGAEAPGRPAAGAAQAARTTGRVIAVSTGYAGGAGKSTLIANMAAWIANRAFQKVVVVDLEKGRGSIRSLFDPQMTPKPNVLDFRDWAGQPQIPPETLRGMLQQDNVATRKFHVPIVFAPGSFELSEEVTGELVTTLITSLRFEFPYVLVDLPGDATDAAFAAMRLATTTLWLVRPSIQDFDRDADILGLLRRAGVDVARFQALVNFIPQGARPPFSPAQIQKALGMRLMPWAIPYDPKVAMATPGHFAAIEDPKGPYASALRKVVEELCPELRAEAPAAGRAAQRSGGFFARLFGRATA